MQPTLVSIELYSLPCYISELQIVLLKYQCFEESLFRSLIGVTSAGSLILHFEK
jgi:hypothetical protein